MRKHLALGAAVLLLLAGCGGDEPAGNDAVYKLSFKVVRWEGFPDQLKPPSEGEVRRMKEARQVEWVDPASGRWRFYSRFRVEPGSSEFDEVTMIFTGSACFKDASYSSPSLRVGSPRFLGPCAHSLALAALERYVKSGRQPPERFPVKRGGLEVVATIVETITRAEAEERGLFQIPDDVWDVTREVEPGERPTLPVKAYWFGPKLEERLAVTAVERRGTDGTVYTTFYVPPGGVSHAYPGATKYSGNEIQVTCFRLDSAYATKVLPELRAETGTKVTLKNGEQATAFRLGGAFWFVTETTLVSMGRVSGDLRALAARLRPV